MRRDVVDRLLVSFTSLSHDVLSGGFAGGCQRIGDDPFIAAFRPAGRTLELESRLVWRRLLSPVVQGLRSFTFDSGAGSECVGTRQDVISGAQSLERLCRGSEGL